MTTGAIFVEVLDRGDHLSQRLRFGSLPIRIGRGYGNDVIVDDPYLAANHLVIEAEGDGTLSARDAGTTNGIHLAHAGKRWWRADVRQEHIPLDGNTVVRAGHTCFRVRREDFAIAKEQPDTTSHSWEGIAPALSGLVLLTAISTFHAWQTSSTEHLAPHYVAQLTPIFSVVVAWAALWSLLNRLFGSRARFGRHLLTAAIAVVGIELVSQLLSQAEYSFSLSWLARHDDYFVYGLLAVAVYFHVRTLRPLTPALARNVAFAFALLSTALLAGWQYADEKTLEFSPYMADMSWPTSRVAGADPGEEFVRRASSLTASVDGRRADPPAPDNVDED